MVSAVDVSVVVSTHNRAHLLRPCLDALIRQCGPGAYEVIVVDNNSSDGTSAVIADFLRTPVPVRAARESRQGVSYGRNAGIALARGRIVAFTDDDIRVAPDWVSRIQAAFDEDAAVDCLGGPVRPLWSSPPPRWLDRRHWSPLSLTDYGHEPFDITADRPKCLLTSNMAFRREVFDRVGTFSSDFPRAQDHELQVRFWLSGGRARYRPDLVVYTMVPESRLRLSYHRRWHVHHGHMCARMDLRERTRPDGGLRAAPLAERHLAGVPAFLWRELGEACRLWVKSWASWNRASRLEQEMRVRHLVGYIAERRSRPVAGAGMERDPGRLETPTARMPAGRRLMAHAAILAVVGGAAFDIVRDEEHWPYSPYPMFSSVDRDWSHRTLRLFAVGADDRETALLDRDVPAPFDQCRLSTALRRLAGDQAALRAALADTYGRLTRSRGPGATAVALRLYELRWQLRRGESHDGTPDRQTLVAEYRPQAPR